MMESLNQLLVLHGDDFRLPKSMSTFLRRSPLESFSAIGTKHYAVCPTCHQLSSLKSKPDISQISCDRPLQQAAYIPSGSGEFCKGRVYDFEDAKLVPKLVYSYCSVTSTLKKFFLRKGFADQVKKWKTRQPSKNYLFDVYDGTGFLEFKTSPTEPPFVFESDYNLLLSLNIDWFSPFNSNHSVGCIYLTIQNLPKQNGRDLKRNMILVGVIPGPKEPPTTSINSYLAPMVKDLKKLLKGVTMKMVMQDGTVGHHKVKACLFSVSSDLPATKKLAGSMSFNSGYGCHLCKTFFPGFAGAGNRRNYCQWNCDQWPRRSVQETRLSSLAWKNAGTVGERTTLEKNSGVRYSILFELPYYSYDTLAIEPMHVLYLGIARKALKTMLPEGALLKIRKIMQEEMVFDPEAPCVPMAKKIVKEGLPYVKAVEFKEFMVSAAEQLLSPPMLSSADYELMMHFVKALRLLDANAIKRSDVEVAHSHLLAFALGFERRFGSESVAPNFHFMLHLRECIEKFGPISCFWGFGFERNNLFIKNINTNHKPGFEKTYMKQMQSIIFADDHDSVAHYDS